MFNLFKKQPAQPVPTYGTDFQSVRVGMVLPHIYGEHGAGEAEILKVKGNRIVALQLHPIIKSKQTYVFVPVNSETKEMPHYVREDQQGQEFAEKIFV